MGQSIAMQMSRAQALAPALQRSLRLLQMNALEFSQEVQNALDSNPMLEEDEHAPRPGLDDDAGPSGSVGAESIPDAFDAAAEPGTDTIAEAVAGPDGEVPVGDDTLGEASIGMTEWGEPPRDSSRDRGGNDVTAIDIAAADRSLRDHLLEQLGALPLTPLEQGLAAVVIDSIDPTGYLREDLSSLTAIGQQLVDEGALDIGRRIEEADMKIALARVQSLEPAGIGARSVAECLSLQLRVLPETTAGLATARSIVTDHLEQLAGNDFRGLVQALGVDDDALTAAVRLIRSLDPKPGLAYGDELVAYAVPEVIVRKIGRTWVASLHPTATPRIRINAAYADVVNRDGGGSGDGLGRQLQEAQWLLRSIAQRAETIEKTAAAIVARQQAFFEHGDIGLQPMKLADIAADVGVHESTVSRVVNSKYLQCPSGLVPLRRFFTSHVETAAGAACSATAVKAMIRQLVDAETAGDPHSDHRLTRLLLQRGIRISRRTVTKYRDALGIEAADLRRQLTPAGSGDDGEGLSAKRAATIRRVSRKAAGAGHAACGVRAA